MVNGVATQSGGDVGFASQTDGTDGEIAQGGHDLGCGAGAYLRPVFIEGNVPGPVHSVLYAPGSPPYSEEPLGTGLGGRQSGYGVGQLPAGGVLAADDAFQSSYLGQERKRGRNWRWAMSAISMATRREW